MIDQAEKLRLMVKTMKIRVENEISGHTKRTRIIAVTSGKGGVGKSNFTLNLALALMEYGQRVMILDADLGMANIDVILGLTPHYNLYDVINGNLSIEEIVASGPRGLRIIPGGSGITELANLTAEEIDRFIHSLDRLEENSDVLLIDTGAGISRNVLNFVLAADEVILLTTPEPTAITDAYGLLKALAKQGYRGSISLVVNRVDNYGEGEGAGKKLKKAAKGFLQVDIDLCGFIWEDSRVAKAVRMQQPFLLAFPHSPASTCIYKIGAEICGKPMLSKGNGFKGFISRVISLIE